jgi:hypothetical protein
MNDQANIFQPPRQIGLLFNIGVIVVLTLAAVWLFILAVNAPLGLPFLLYLLGALNLAVPLPVLAFRLYGLLRSHYDLERNGIRLQWGFRAEDIPITSVQWVHLAEDLITPLELPRIRWPGALVGEMTHPELGTVEFMASEAVGLVLIGTQNKTYVISPEAPQKFTRTFQNQLEMGSLAPFPAYSAYPRFLLLDIWRLPVARGFLIVSVVLSLALFIWVALLVPTLSTVSLGFSPTKESLPPVASSQLFLLPVVNLLLQVAGNLLAMYYYRQDQNHPLMYVLWISGTLMVILFLAAIFFIL